MHPAWKPRKAEWVMLAPGVRFKMRVPNGEERLMAAAETAKAMATLRDGGELLEGFGLEGELELIQPDVIMGLAALVGAAFLADQVVEDWEGVGDENGEPIPLTGETMRLCLRQGLPDGGAPLVEAFLAWCDKSRAPVAQDLARLRALAEWEFSLSGPEHCKGCALEGAACATGGKPEGGALCPRTKNQPQTMPGLAAWAVAMRPGLWQRAGMGGAISGLSYADALAAAQAEGCHDLGGLVRCFGAIEAGALAAMAADHAARTNP